VAAYGQRAQLSMQRSLASLQALQAQVAAQNAANLRALGSVGTTTDAKTGLPIVPVSLTTPNVSIDGIGSNALNPIGGAVVNPASSGIQNVQLQGAGSGVSLAGGGQVSLVSGTGSGQVNASGAGSITATGGTITATTGGLSTSTTSGGTLTTTNGGTVATTSANETISSSASTTVTISGSGGTITALDGTTTTFATPTTSLSYTIPAGSTISLTSAGQVAATGATTLSLSGAGTLATATGGTVSNTGGTTTFSSGVAATLPGGAAINFSSNGSLTLASGASAFSINLPAGVPLSTIGSATVSTTTGYQLPSSWVNVGSLSDSKPIAPASGGLTDLVTVVQTGQQAVLQWNSFNIGPHTELDFDQSAGGANVGNWVVINELTANLSPSWIMGSIQAPGQVYVINQNGIIFTGTSQINTHTLVASSLPINNNLVSGSNPGLLNNSTDLSYLFSSLQSSTTGAGLFTPPLSTSSSASPTEIGGTAPDGGTVVNVSTGGVVVEAGAQIQSPTNAEHVGGRVALIGPSVENDGTIYTPDGQTILAAGFQVGFLPHASTDPSLRGLDVYIGAATDSTGVYNSNPLVQDGLFPTVGIAANGIANNDPAALTLGVPLTTGTYPLTGSGENGSSLLGVIAQLNQVAVAATPGNLGTPASAVTLTSPGALTLQSGLSATSSVTVSGSAGYVLAPDGTKTAFTIGASLTNLASGSQVVFTGSNGSMTLVAGSAPVLLPAGIGFTTSTSVQLESIGGIIEAPRADVYMAGANIQQNSFVDSSTSVSLNGRVDIQATYDEVTYDTSVDGATVVAGLPTLTGTVTFGPGSTTQILPELSSETVVGSQLALPSLIEVQGQSINMDESALLWAPGANISQTLNATTGKLVTISQDAWGDLMPAGITFTAGTYGTNTAGAPIFQYNTGTIEVGDQAVIDASGSDGYGYTTTVNSTATGSLTFDVSQLQNVTSSVAENIVPVQLRGTELANSPVQQNGPLRGQTVYVDMSQYGLNANGTYWIGSPIGDLSGYAALIQHTAEELTTNGGTIALKAGASVTLDTNSTVDVSGGSITYTGAFVQTTKVVTSDGQILDISQATPGLVYDGILTDVTVGSSKWGVSQSYANSQLAPQYDPGYIQGGNGGALSITAPTVALNGALSGNSIAGANQIQIQNTLPTAFGATTGLLMIQSIYGAPQASSLTIDFSNSPLVSGTPTRTSDPNLNIVFDPGEVANTNPSVTEFDFSTNLTNVDGFGNLTLNDDFGSIKLSSDAPLTMSPGGSLYLNASTIDIQGNISLPGGTLQLASTNSIHLDTSVSDVSLDVSGLIVDPASGAALGSNLPLYIKGGSVTLQSSDLIFDSGSSINVSGGLYVSPSSKQTYGAAGTITLNAAIANLAGTQNVTTPEQSEFSLAQGVTLEGYSGLRNGAGTLDIQAPLVQIGGTSLINGGTLQNSLMLSDSFFSQGGFGTFSITGLGDSTDAQRPSVLVAPGTVIDPEVQSWVSEFNGSQVSLTATTLALQSQRSPLSISLNAPGVADSSGTLRAQGNLLIGQGALISLDADPSNSVQLSGGGDGTVAVLGQIIVPGGTISITATGTTSTIYGGGNPATAPQVTVDLGSGSILDASGATELTTNLLGLRTGSVLNGGAISVTGNIFAEHGSQILVDGASDTLAVNSGASDNPGSGIGAVSTSYVNVPVDSNGGSITLAGVEALSTEATLSGKPGGTSAHGGSLTVSSGSFFSAADNNAGLTQTFANDASLVLTNSGATYATGATADLSQPANGVTLTNPGAVFLQSGLSATSSVLVGGSAGYVQTPDGTKTPFTAGVSLSNLPGGSEVVFTGSNGSLTLVSGSAPVLLPAGVGFTASSAVQLESSVVVSTVAQLDQSAGTVSLASPGALILQSGLSTTSSVTVGGSAGYVQTPDGTQTPFNPGASLTNLPSGSEVVFTGSNGSLTRTAGNTPVLLPTGVEFTTNTPVQVESSGDVVGTPFITDPTQVAQGILLTNPVEDSHAKTIYGNFSSQEFAGSGLASLTLNPSGNLEIASGGGNVTLLAAASISVAGNGVILLDDPTQSTTVTLTAPYVDMGAYYTPAQQQTQQQPVFVDGVETLPHVYLDPTTHTPYALTPVQGSGTLDVNASTLVDVGTTSLLGFGTLNINQSGSTAGDVRGFGTLELQGNINIEAGQIYPATEATFTIAAYSGTIDITGTGQLPALPYSAGGTLNLYANTISQDGVLRAPMGVINIGAAANTLDIVSQSNFDTATKVELGADSTTSVSLIDPNTNTALVVPYGTNQNGTDWYDPAGNDITLKPNGALGIPIKQVFVVGSQVLDDSGAVIDIEGGGDLSSARWVTGTGGTLDILNTNNTAGSFAVIPGYGQAYAPLDPTLGYTTSPSQDAAQIAAQNTSLTSKQASAQAASLTPADLKVGDSVYLSAGSGLPAGYYTLLPAQYALLPGAYLVTPKSSTPVLPGSIQAGTQTDGSTLVTGYRYNGLASPSAPSLDTIFEVASGAVVHARAEYDDFSANTFLQESAVNGNISVPRLPVDAGQLVFNAITQPNTVTSLTLDGSSTIQTTAGAITISTPSGVAGLVEPVTIGALTPGGPEDVTLTGTGTVATSTVDGQGGLVDISSTSPIDILDSTASETNAGENPLVLLTSQLNGLNASSLLIGGTRGTDGETVTVATSELDVSDQDSPLSGQDLILVSSDTLNVYSGSVIATPPSNSAITPTPIIVEGNGALIRVSSGQNGKVTRANPTSSGQSALLNIEDAQISAGTIAQLTNAANSVTLTKPGELVLQSGLSAASSVTVGGSAGYVLTPNGVKTTFKIGDTLSNLPSGSTINFTSGNGSLALVAGSAPVEIPAGLAYTTSAAVQTIPQSVGTLVLDSTGNFSLDATASLASVLSGDTLTFNAGQINILFKNNNVPTSVSNNFSGLVLTDSQIQTLQESVKNLDFMSYSSIDLYGTGSLGTNALGATVLDNLGFEASQIRGYYYPSTLTTNAGITFSALQGVSLENSAAFNLTATGANPISSLFENNLTVSAPTIQIGGGTGANTLALNGFTNVDLTATNEILAVSTATANQSTSTSLPQAVFDAVDGGLNITAPLIASQSGANVEIIAGNTTTKVYQNIQMTSGGAPDPALEQGLDGALDIQGASITDSGAIVMPSGQVTLEAKSGSLTMSGSIDVSGSATVFNQSITKYTNGGTVTLKADSGNLDLTGGMVNVSAPSALGATAANVGSVTLQASGTLTVDNTTQLRGQGASGNIVQLAQLGSAVTLNAPGTLVLQSALSAANSVTVSGSAGYVLAPDGTQTAFKLGDKLSGFPSGSMVVFTGSNGSLTVGAGSVPLLLATGVEFSTSSGVSVTAVTQGQNGTFSLDAGSTNAGTGTTSDLGLLASILSPAQGDFTQSQSYRIRSGDVQIGASTVLTANTFNLSADNGNVDVLGTINAAGLTGGQVALDAAGNVTLHKGSLVTVAGQGFADSGKGGAVTLQGGAYNGNVNTAVGVNIASGATVDLSVGSGDVVQLDQPANAITLTNPGTLTLQSGLSTESSVTVGGSAGYVLTPGGTRTSFASGASLSNLPDGSMVIFTGSGGSLTLAAGSAPVLVPAGAGFTTSSAVQLGTSGTSALAFQPGTTVTLPSGTPGDDQILFYGSGTLTEPSGTLITFVTTSDPGHSDDGTVTVTTTPPGGSPVAIAPGAISLPAGSSIQFAANSLNDAISFANGGTGGAIPLALAATDTMVAPIALGNTTGTLKIIVPAVNFGTTGIIVAGNILSPSSIVLEGSEVYGNTNPTLAETVSIDGLESTIVSDAQIVTTNSTVAPSWTTTDDNSSWNSQISTILGTDSNLSGVTTANFGAEIVNAHGDLTLTHTWNLSSLSTANIVGDLTLRASGNVILQGGTFNSATSTYTSGASLTDGFSANASNPTALWEDTLNTTPSWSFNITAGADLTSADVYEVIPQVSSALTPVASLVIGYNGPSKTVDQASEGTAKAQGTTTTTQNILTAYYQTIRTGTGNITISTGNDVRLMNALANIYTAGQQLTPSQTTSVFYTNDFNAPQLTIPLGFGGTGNYKTTLGYLPNTITYAAQYSLSGGNVTILADGNIEHVTQTGGQDSSREMPTSWLDRRGYTNNGLFADNRDLTSLPGGIASTTWWVDFSNFFEGIGALGGGNVTLVAGGSVNNVDAVIPTNARMIGTLPNAPGTGTAGYTGVGIAPNVGNLDELGGGDLVVQAGDNINGGVYYVERGTGALDAGYKIMTNSTRAAVTATEVGSNTLSPTTDPQTWLPTTLFAGAASFNVSAGNDLDLGSTFNPFLLPQNIDNSFLLKTYYSTYATTDVVNVESLTGNITIEGDGSSTSNTGTLSAWYDNVLGFVSNKGKSWSYLQPWLGLSESVPSIFTTATSLLPSTLQVVAFSDNSQGTSGNINLVGNLTLSPSPTGNLELVAANSVTGLSFEIQNLAGQYTTINVSDANPNKIAGVASPISLPSTDNSVTDISWDATPSTSVLDLFSPLNVLFAETSSTNNLLATENDLHGSIIGSDGVLEPLHYGDSTPVQIDAGTGDISGFTLFSPKVTNIIAGQDITDIGFYLQNTSADDVSIVSAGRDLIAYDSNSAARLSLDRTYNLTPTGLPPSESGDIQIGGPGAIEVLAGQNFNLGVSTGTASTGLGLTSIGNSSNPALPFAGANIIAGAGLGNPAGLDSPASNLDFQAFIADYLTPGTTEGDMYLPDLGLLLGLNTASETAIRTSFNLLPEDIQNTYALTIFYDVLRDAGRSQGFPSGYTAIEALFPGTGNASSTGFVNTWPYTGDISLTSREIKTTNGGNISLLVPGGQLTVGLPINGSQTLEQGIFTVDGGNISIFANNNVNVGVSRIFTLNGGNEIIWSSLGDIDAGSSSKTVQSAPPTTVLVDPQSGNVQTDLAGLATGGGIGVLEAFAGAGASDVDLIAPNGTIDAGDAGIRASGDVHVSALHIANASNITAGGTTSGVPATASTNVAGVAAASSAAGAATQAGMDNTPNHNNAMAQQPPADLPSIITVEVLGYGGADTD